MQTFVLQEVVNDLVNINSPLEGALLKLNYFAHLTKNDELVLYTESEINGYHYEASVPEYRKGIARLMINIQTGYGNIEVRELPIAMLPEPLNIEMRYHRIHEGVRVIESMTQPTNLIDHPEIEKKLPMEILPMIQEPASRLFRTAGGITVTAARIIANATILTQILSTVRSRLLAFSMKIAEEYGFEIQLQPFQPNETVNNQTINNFFRTEVINHGDHNVLNTGDGANIETDR
jgi:hypothetical protein